MSWTKVDGYTAQTMGSGCLICRNGNVRNLSNGPETILNSGYVDNFAGTPDICATCIGEAARMIGYVSGEEFAQQVLISADSLVQNADLKLQMADKDATIRVLTKELAPTPVEKKVKADA